MIGHTLFTLTATDQISSLRVSCTEMLPSNEIARDTDRSMNYKTAVWSHNKTEGTNTSGESKIKKRRIMHIRLSQTVVPVPLAYRSSFLGARLVLNRTFRH